MTDQAAPDGEHNGGSGETLVLLHGMSGTWRDWQAVLPELESRHHVHAPTMPWHHGGPPLVEGTSPTITGLVDGVEAQLDGAGIATAHLVGNSLGGWVALELARRGRARSVVVLSPAAAWGDDRDYKRVVRLLSVGHHLVRASAPRSRLVGRSRLLRRLLFGAAVANPMAFSADEVTDRLVASASCTWTTRLMEEVGAAGQIAPLATDVPIIVAWAERDRVVPFERYGRPLLARLPAATRFVMLPGVGHVPMSDAPALVARTILEAVSDSVSGRSD